MLKKYNMKSKLLDILTCVLKILSDFKKGIITPKKEERKKKKSWWKKYYVSLFASLPESLK